MSWKYHSSFKFLWSNESLFSDNPWYNKIERAMALSSFSIHMIGIWNPLFMVAVFFIYLLEHWFAYVDTLLQRLLYIFFKSSTTCRIFRDPWSSSATCLSVLLLENLPKKIPYKLFSCIAQVPTIFFHVAVKNIIHNKQLLNVLNQQNFQDLFKFLSQRKSSYNIEYKCKYYKFI